MEKLLEILWGSVAIFAIMGFFVVMYFSASKIYDFNIRTKKDNPTLFKIIGSNEKYLYERDKWIRHYRRYIILMGLLLLSLIIPFIIMLE